jgi:hypothetical protein
VGLEAALSLLVYAGALFLSRLLVREDLVLVRRIFSTDEALAPKY